MKKFFYFVFAAMLCCGFVACSDSDEKESGGSASEELLLGTWHLVKYCWIEDNEWYYSDDEYDKSNFMTFLPNGGGYYGLWEEFMFEWQLVGSNIYFREEDGEKWDAKIVKLTERELVLDDGWYCEYYERY